MLLSQFANAADWARYDPNTGSYKLELDETGYDQPDHPYRYGQDGGTGRFIESEFENHGYEEEQDRTNDQSY
jgi:hypothetical protein